MNEPDDAPGPTGKDALASGAVTRRPGETAAEHLDRFHGIDKADLSVEQLLQMSQHKAGLAEAAQQETGLPRPVQPAGEQVTPPDGISALGLAKAVYARLSARQKGEFRRWLSSVGE